MLRVANVRSEAVLEGVRDALDRLGVDYEHIRSEPGEDTYPQTAYFYVPDGSADDVDKHHSAALRGARFRRRVALTDCDAP